MKTSVLKSGNDRTVSSIHPGREHFFHLAMRNPLTHATLLTSVVMMSALMTSGCSTTREKEIGYKEIQFKSIDYSDIEGMSGHHTLPSVRFSFMENSVSVNCSALNGNFANDTLLSYAFKPGSSTIWTDDYNLQISFRDLLSGDSVSVSFDVLRGVNHFLVESMEGDDVLSGRFLFSCGDAGMILPEGIIDGANGQVISSMASVLGDYDWHHVDETGVLELADEVTTVNLDGDDVRHLYRISDWWGMLDKNGMPLLPATYNLIAKDIHSNFKIIEKDNDGDYLFGLANAGGDILLDCLFDSILDYVIDGDDNRFYYCCYYDSDGDEREGAIDKFGNVIYDVGPYSIDYYYPDEEDREIQRECFLVSNADGDDFFSNMYLDGEGRLSYYEKPRETFLGRLVYDKYGDPLSRFSSLKIYDKYIVENVNVYPLVFQGSDYDEYSRDGAFRLRLYKDNSRFQYISDGVLYREFKLEKTRD